MGEEEARSIISGGSAVAGAKSAILGNAGLEVMALSMPFSGMAALSVSDNVLLVSFVTVSDVLVYSGH